MALANIFDHLSFSDDIRYIATVSKEWFHVCLYFSEIHYKMRMIEFGKGWTMNNFKYQDTWHGAYKELSLLHGILINKGLNHFASPVVVDRSRSFETRMLYSSRLLYSEGDVVVKDSDLEELLICNADAQLVKPQSCEGRALWLKHYRICKWSDDEKGYTMCNGTTLLPPNTVTSFATDVCAAYPIHIYKFEGGNTNKTISQDVRAAITFKGDKFMVTKPVYVRAYADGKQELTLSNDVACF